MADFEGSADFNAFASGPDFQPRKTNETMKCGCAIDRALHRQGNFIYITGAQKQSDGGSNSYVAYNIRVGDIETRRRYSEFESLRKALMRLYPTVIVPPIPEKHSITDYAAIQKSVKDDVVMIEKRKRMLQSFLNRVLNHSKLGSEHVFHRFLESGVSWSEVLHSPPLSTLPKNPLHVSLAPKSTGDMQGSDVSVQPSSSSSSSLIPMPSASHTLRNPDSRFVESEAFTNKAAHHMSSSVDKTQRRVIRRLGELANDYAELGAVYNGFSLNENGQLANAIEKVGQAVDSSYTLTGQLISSLEAEFSEPIQEYAQFTQTIKQVLKYRHMKHAQVEMIFDSLENKKLTLESLVRIEAEAKRLEEAMNSGRQSSYNNNSSSYDNAESNPYSQGYDDENNQDRQETSEPDEISSSVLTSEHPEVDPEADNPYATVYPTGAGAAALRASRQRSKRWSGPTKIFSAVSHTLHGIIDVDPEATRRNQIGKTKDAVVQLEQALQITRKDLVDISANTQADLDRFQRQKIRDLRDMLIAYAKVHVKYCEKNLASWEEAKEAVAQIPEL
ncbi:Sorting nexin [Umbelopsis nana]